MRAQKTYTITVTENELTTIINALVYRDHRLSRLARLAHKQGREREEAARLESAEQTAKLADRLAELAAREAE